MKDIECGICHSTAVTRDKYDNLSCAGCRATGTVGLDGENYWEPDEAWTGEELDGHHGYGQHDNDNEGNGSGQSIGENDEDLGEIEEDAPSYGDGEGDDEGDGEGEGEPKDGDFEIVFESRDYEHESEGQDGFPDPVSIVVDGVGKLLPAVRWLRDITSLRDGKPIGLEEARDAITAVAKENKRIEVKDVPAEASNIVLTAATFSNVVAREFTPPTPEEQEALAKEKEKKEEAAGA